MKIAIFSDVHANLEALEAVAGDLVRQGVDRTVCLGDVVGYNADPAPCLELVRKLAPVCVGGNHDRAVAGEITTAGFSERAARAVVWTRDHLDDDALRFLADLPLEASIDHHLVAVHGALLPGGGCEKTYLASDEQRRRSFEALRRHPSRSRICAYGHTHELAVFELRDGAVEARAGDEISLREDRYYLINPGTVGESRDVNERRATYLVLDTARRTVSVRRVEYDHAASALKTKEAGLAARRPITATIRAVVRWGMRRVGRDRSARGPELTSAREEGGPPAA